MCEHTYWDEPVRDMTFEEFKRAVDQFPGLKWIGLTGIGESFVNKDFMKMLGYVKSKGIFVELYDNLFYATKDQIKKLVELEIDKLFISIDAATKKTYEKMRVNAKFERVIDNIDFLFQTKKEKNSFFPEVAFHYVVTSLNVDEMPQFLDMVSSMGGGGHEIIFTRMLHSYDKVRNLFVEVPNSRVEELAEKGKKLGLKVAWNADVPQSKPHVRKCTEWIMPFIFVTGHVVPCCAGNESNCREFQKKHALGNIHEKPFKEIWHGKEYEEFRKMLKEGKAPVQCVGCPLYEAKKLKRPPKD
jgi:radical SAM protein with 4Fe4S-binding SPASM domain